MLAFFAATLLTTAAYAAPDPVWYRNGRVVEAPLSAQVGGAFHRGQIPPYSLSPRDIGGAEAAITWRPADPVQLSMSWGFYGAQWPDGSRVLGPGDLRLATQARLSKGQGRRPDLWLAWDLKLPNAARPLGTDEADTSVALWARQSTELWTWELGAGLWIAGHPDQLAAQDDALIVQARASRTLGSGFLLAAGDLRVVSGRNPTDASVGLGWEQPLSERVHIGAMGELGLSPAAADQGARVWLALVPHPSGA